MQDVFLFHKNACAFRQDLSSQDERLDCPMDKMEKDAGLNDLGNLSDLLFFFILKEESYRNLPESFFSFY
jgi:hypothetical protein